MKSNFLISISTHSNDKLGELSFFESNKDIPFDFKRIYYIYNVPKETKRGYHAHKKLKQVLWCPYGSIEVLLDDGNEKKIYILDSPEKALLVLEGYWREMKWQKKDSVLCVAASDFYDENDYIRDYDEFIGYSKRGDWNNENKF